MKILLCILVLCCSLNAEVNQVKKLVLKDLTLNHYGTDGSVETKVEDIDQDLKIKKFNFIHYPKFLLLPKISEVKKVSSKNLLGVFYTSLCENLYRNLNICKKYKEEALKKKNSLLKDLNREKENLKKIDKLLVPYQKIVIQTIENSVDSCDLFLELCDDFELKFNFLRKHEILFLGSLKFSRGETNYYLLLLKFYRNGRLINYFEKDLSMYGERLQHYAVISEKDKHFKLESLNDKLSFELYDDDNDLYHKLFNNYFFKHDGELSIKDFDNKFKIPNILPK